MKHMKRLICMLLTLVMVLSMIPMFAAAKEEAEKEKVPTGKVTVKVVLPSGTLRKDTVKVKDEDVKLKYDTYLTSGGVVYEFSHYLIGKEKVQKVVIPAYDETTAWEKEWGSTISVVYVRHYHSFKPGYNRMEHWDFCECGKTQNKEKHVDPALDEDKVCTCGYKFSSNCDLVTLWLSGMNLSPRFNKGTTEYIGNIHTYKDITSTSISVKTFDALATISLPTDLTIRDGINKFEITVTAEDTVSTKTYTVIATKAIKVNGVDILTTDKDISIAPNVKVSKGAAQVTVDPAVGVKMAEMAAEYGLAQVVVAPKFHKGAAKQADVTISAEVLKAIAEKNLTLTVKTPYSADLSIPAAELLTLAEMGENITFVITKDAEFSILANGEAISEAPALIALITY